MTDSHCPVCNICFHLTWQLMPQSHPTTSPERFLTPVRFLARKAEWRRVGILRRCCSRGHIRLRPRTAWHVCILIVWLNNSQDSTGTPCDARAGNVRAPHGNLQCFSYPTGPVRKSCATRKDAVRRPYGHVRELTQPYRVKKIQCGPVRTPCGPNTGCSQDVYNLWTRTGPVSL